jgi:hypothetical protein
MFVAGDDASRCDEKQMRDACMCKAYAAKTMAARSGDTECKLILRMFNSPKGRKVDGSGCNWIRTINGTVHTNAGLTTSTHRKNKSRQKIDNKVNKLPWCNGGDESTCVGYSKNVM